MTLLMIGWSEILIIALIVLLLFGGKKIPELMKGLGKGVKSFKDGMNGVNDESSASKDYGGPAPTPKSNGDASTPGNNESPSTPQDDNGSSNN